MPPAPGAARPQRGAGATGSRRHRSCQLMTTDAAPVCAGSALGCIDGFDGYRVPLKRIRTSPFPFAKTIKVLQPCDLSGETRIGALVIVLAETKVKPSLTPRNTSMLQPPDPHQLLPSSSTIASARPSPSRSVRACRNGGSTWSPVLPT